MEDLSGGSGGVSAPTVLVESVLPVGGDDAVLAHGDLDRARLEEAAGGLLVAYARMVTVLRTVLVTGGWHGTGMRSPQQWLTCFAGVSRAVANDIVQVASRADELPVVMSGFAEGRLTFHQVAVIARHAPARYDAEVAQLAEHCDVGQLSRALSRYVFMPDPDAEPAEDVAEEADDGVDEVLPPVLSPAEEAAVAPATVSSWFEAGRYHLKYEAPADEGAVVERALCEAKDGLFHLTRHPDKAALAQIGAGEDCAGSVEGEQLDAAARAELEVAPGETDAAGKPRITLGDALVEVARRALRAGCAEVAGRADAFRVLLHLDVDGKGWLHRKGAVPPAIWQRLTCDGKVIPVGERDGLPVDVGRTQRIVPRRVRRLVEDRDRGCVVPGCGATRFVEVHHVVHWSAGGATDLVNLVCLCPFHHDALHRGEFSIVAAPGGGFAVYDRWGVRLGYRGRPPSRAAAARVAGAAAYEKPSFYPLILKWVDLEPPRRRAARDDSDDEDAVGDDP